MSKNFKPKTQVIIDQANEIIREYLEQGMSLSLRQLYYRFVAGALLENKQTEYSRLGSIINDARLAGLINWRAIEDRGRQLLAFRTFADPGQAVRSIVSTYQIDRWSDQVHRVEVWVEKQALEAVVEGAADEYQVPTFSCKGYNSQSEMWRAAMRFQRYQGKGQVPVIIHLGDHDPSGIDMTRDIIDRLETFGMPMEVNRIALNMDQVEKYDPPPYPAKQTDSRCTGYFEKYGDDSWELDALEPAVMKKLIQKTIKKYMDKSLYDARVDQEESERSRLDDMADNWKD